MLIDMDYRSLSFSEICSAVLLCQFLIFKRWVTCVIICIWHSPTAFSFLKFKIWISSSLTKGFLSTPLPINLLHDSVNSSTCEWQFRRHIGKGLWGAEWTENPWLAKMKYFVYMYDCTMYWVTQYGNYPLHDMNTFCCVAVHSREISIFIYLCSLQSIDNFLSEHWIL